MYTKKNEETGEMKTVLYKCYVLFSFSYKNK